MRLRKAFQVTTVTLLVQKLDVNPRRAVLKTARASELPCSSSSQKMLCSPPLLVQGEHLTSWAFSPGSVGWGCFVMLTDVVRAKAQGPQVRIPAGFCSMVLYSNPLWLLEIYMISYQKALKTMTGSQ